MAPTLSSATGRNRLRRSPVGDKTRIAQHVEPAVFPAIHEDSIEHRLDQRPPGRELAIEQWVRYTDAAGQFAGLDGESRFGQVADGRIEILAASHLGVESKRPGFGRRLLCGHSQGHSNQHGFARAQAPGRFNGDGGLAGLPVFQHVPWPRVS